MAKKIYIVTHNLPDTDQALVSAFSTLERAQEEITRDSKHLPVIIGWRSFTTDMKSVVGWKIIYEGYDKKPLAYYITEYPLDEFTLDLAGISIARQS